MDSWREYNCQGLDRCFVLCFSGEWVKDFGLGSSGFLCSGCIIHVKAVVLVCMSDLVLGGRHQARAGCMLD